METADTVKYSKPMNEAEVSARFTLMEHNGNRVLIRCTEPITKGGTLHSMQTVAVNEVELA